MLVEAPPLRATLTSPDWTALAACSRQLRQVVKQSTTAITIQDPSHVQQVLQGTWPNLALIKVQPAAVLACGPSLEALFTGELQLVAWLHCGFTFHPSEYCEATQPSDNLKAFRKQQSMTALVVKPAAQQDQFAQHVALTAAFSHIHSSAWRCLDHLIVKLHLLDAEIMARLVETDLSCLKILDLRGNHLGVAAFQHLACGAWPLLEKLDLTNTRLDVAAMPALTKVAWQDLQKLALSSCDLAPNFAAILVLIDLPRLAVLDLSNNNLGDNAATELAKGGWPCLSQLRLDNNNFNNAAMAPLAEGMWPALTCLSLIGSSVDESGIQLLMRGDWPQLRWLTLDRRSVNAGNLCVLKSLLTLALDANLAAKLLDLEEFDMYRDSAALSARDNIEWPQLKFIQFRHDPLVWRSNSVTTSATRDLSSAEGSTVLPSVIGACATCHEAFGNATLGCKSWFDCYLSPCTGVSTAYQVVSAGIVACVLIWYAKHTH